MIEEHNKIIEEKKSFWKKLRKHWFRIGTNFHKCFLFILCWFIWTCVLFTCWYCMGGILEIFIDYLLVWNLSKTTRRCSLLVIKYNSFNLAWSDTPPKLLNRQNCESKGENMGKIKSWGTLLGSQHFEGKGVCWNSEMGLRWVKSGSIIHTDLHKSNNKLVSAWLEHL
jgi:hypothetical protein